MVMNLLKIVKQIELIFFIRFVFYLGIFLVFLQVDDSAIVPWLQLMSPHFQIESMSFFIQKNLFSL